ncbi:MAG TPA: hypothetical protein VLB45_04430 [Nitrosopumilaceae archaeon]|nr:hypothetical protein [Nitrosopumilaceae archaeon]
MPLTAREKAIVSITNAIMIYSQKMEDGTISPNQSIIDFVLKLVPSDLKSEISIELIDEIFSHVSN